MQYPTLRQSKEEKGVCLAAFRIEIPACPFDQRGDTSWPMLTNARMSPYPLRRSLGLDSFSAMNLVEHCKIHARAATRRLVLSEGHDERIVAAARRLRDEGIATPVLLGDAGTVGAAARRAGVPIDGLLLVDPEVDARIADYAARYVAGRLNLNLRLAHRLVRARRPIPCLRHPRRELFLESATRVGKRNYR